MQKSDLPEPWLRGTLNDVPAVQRAVLHALELAREDLERWCDGLSDEELHARPGGLRRWHFIFATLREAWIGCSPMRKATSFPPIRFLR